VLGLTVMIERAQGRAPETQAVMLGAD
jgi:hypothetical protein